ncbi:hypothetical protein Fot_05960 [Forsythia ovata]|uniref:Uncharacterized protein n=1 Tax=Forsythia ovata TaxID=205694 RepID=A0ABD1WRL4_9LAMI
MGPFLEAPLPAGPSHLSTAPSYISSLLPTPILSVSQSLDVSRPVDPAIVPSSHVGPTTDLLQTSAFAYDYSLHDRLLTIAGPTGSLPLAVDHYAESRSVIDPVYGSSLHDRPAISVGPTILWLIQNCCSKKFRARFDVVAGVVIQCEALYECALN